jgi:hypothetical protein
MVAMFEIAFLIVCVALFLWWFTRTSLFRAQRRSGAAGWGSNLNYRHFGFVPNQKPIPPEHPGSEE